MNELHQNRVRAKFERRSRVKFERRLTRDSASHGITNSMEAMPSPGTKSVGPAVDRTADLAQCYLRLANLPNYALDRLNRYEAILWRQAGRILFALDALDRRKPQERRRRFRFGSRQQLPPYERDEC